MLTDAQMKRVGAVAVELVDLILSSIHGDNEIDMAQNSGIVLGVLAQAIKTEIDRRHLEMAKNEG